MKSATTQPEQKGEAREKVELIACPFSHHFDQLRLAQPQIEPYVSDEADGEFAVVCRVCGGSTRRYYRRDMAVRAWNTRANQAEIERLSDALKRCEYDFDVLISRGDLAEEPRAHETLRIIRSALRGESTEKSFRLIKITTQR